MFQETACAEIKQKRQLDLEGKWQKKFHGEIGIPGSIEIKGQSTN